MLSEELKQIIKSYQDFPKEGINFKDIMPILQDPKVYSKLIYAMSSSEIIKNCDAIISIDARGFIFGSSISLISEKPMLVARKTGKLPGALISEKYILEYGENELSIQKEALNRYKKYAIIDDLLATGGTVNCVGNLLKKQNKFISGLLVVVELAELLGRQKLDFAVESIITF
tara:strand:- start:188 stop:706 length:519 start_codon:yes stop_codon:yes gene_type:complete